MKTTDYLVISTSLNPESKSRVLARQAYSLLNAREGAEWLDLQDFELPLCDGNLAYSHANVALVKQKIQAAQCIIVATPIYNFDVNAALKNLIELTGQSWKDKIVGFLCAAGGKSSYMSVMSVANSLMLDFRSIIIPRFVYVDQALGNQGEIDEPIRLRIEELTEAARMLMGRMKTTV
jgi:FMN reductase